MKLYLTFKTPDVLEDAIREKAQQIADEAAEEKKLDNDELLQVYEATYDELKKAGEKWIACGEYINVEIDTDAATCVVRPA